MKLWLDWDERYPVYDLSETERGLHSVELSDEEYADYKAACEVFNDWQDRLSDLRYAAGEG
jgi:hypothetical protein